MALNIGNLLNNPAAMAQAAQNLADNTGIGDEYREEVSAYNARQEAQKLYDKTIAEREAIEQMRKNSESKGNGKKIIIGILALVVVAVIVVIIVKKKK